MERLYALKYYLPVVKNQPMKKLIEHIKEQQTKRSKELIKIEEQKKRAKQKKLPYIYNKKCRNLSEKDVPKYRKAGIILITKITNATIKKQLTDSQSGFRAYSKKVLNELNPSELGMGISTEILIKASTKKFRISEVPIKIFYDGDTSTHNPITHGSSVIISTIKYTSLQRPLTFYGIPSVIFLLIGGIFSYLAIQYYVEVGRLSTNLTIVSATTVLIGIVLLITAILLFSLVSVVRERKD